MSRRTHRVNYNEDNESRDGQSSLSQEVPVAKAAKASAQNKDEPHAHSDGYSSPKLDCRGSQTQTDMDHLIAQIRQSHPLHRCLLIINYLLTNSDAQEVSDARQGNLVLTLESIQNSLVPGLDSGWGTVRYKSTTEVLREIAFALKSILIANKSDIRCCTMCNKVFSEVRKWWQLAGLQQDLTQLRASVGMASSSITNSGAQKTADSTGKANEPFVQDKGLSRFGLGKSHLHKDSGDTYSNTMRSEDCELFDRKIAEIRQEAQKARDNLETISVRKEKELRQLDERLRRCQGRSAENQRKQTVATKQIEKFDRAAELAKVVVNAKVS